jgi:hypothetical protein
MVKTLAKQLEGVLSDFEGMSKTLPSHSVKSHFEGKDPAVREIYDRIIDAVRSLGPVKAEAKKTSIHIVHTTALAGVATRKSHLILTIKSDRKLASPRICRSEQTSANRFHHEIKLVSPNDVDAELIGWLTAAYALSA